MKSLRNSLRLIVQGRDVHKVEKATKWGSLRNFIQKWQVEWGVKLTDHFTITDENDNLNVENLVSKKAGFEDPDNGSLKESSQRGQTCSSWIENVQIQRSLSVRNV